MYLTLLIFHVLAAGLLIGGSAVLSFSLMPRAHKSLGVKRATQELLLWMNYVLVVSLVTGISIAFVKFEPSFVLSSAFMKLGYAHSWLTKIILLIAMGGLLGVMTAKFKKGDRVTILVRILFVIVLVAMILGLTMTRS